MEFKCAVSVEVGQGMTIRGPRCKSSEPPLLIWPPPVRVADDRFFFLAQTSCEWLCRFLSGQRAAQRPLGRFSCWAVLKAAMAQAERESRDQACATGSNILDECTSQKKQRPVRARECDVLEISVPAGPSSQSHVKLQALRKARSVYLEVAPASLSWLPGWCDTETAHPKRKIPSPVEKTNTPHVFWSRTEQSWVCRGPVRTKKFRVQSVAPSGEPIQGEDYKRLFLAQKDFAMQELSRQHQGESAEGGGAPQGVDGQSTEDSGAATSCVESWSGDSAPLSPQAIGEDLAMTSDAESTTDISSLLSM